MFLSNRGSFRPETSGAYTLRRRGRRRPKSGSAIGACAVARLAGSGGPIGDYYGSANTCVEPLSDGSHTVEPLEGVPVVKDLIVDKSQVQARIAETYKRVRVAPLKAEDLNEYNMEHEAELFGINYCARCQVCTAGCPARATNPEYIGPSHMLAVAFRHFDAYDQADRVVEAVQGGLWDCTMCGTCTTLCNQLEIDHLTIWQKLRDAATERGLIVEEA